MVRTLAEDMEAMREFLETALGYPTLPFSVVLAFSCVYWLLAAVGIVDSGDGHAEPGFDGEAAHGLSAMFARLGLGGAPLMLVVALLSLTGWFASYFLQLFLLSHLPDGLRWLLGTGVLAAALAVAVPVTSWTLRPIRRALLRLRPVPQLSILGRIGTVISPQLSSQTGRISVDDGGAGLILQARIGGDAVLQRGARVVLIEHDPQAHVYQVVSEGDYPGGQ